MCGCAAFKAYSADFVEGGALRFLFCVCLELNVSACLTLISFVLVPCSMFLVIECV